MQPEDSNPRSPASLPVSRRRFIALSATGALGAAAPGCDTGVRPRGEDVRPLLTRPAGTDDPAWAHVRAEFILKPGVAYMNNASLGMPPGVVAEAVADGYRALSTEPLHGKHDLQNTIAREVIPGLARLLNTNPDELSLTRNATEALHLQTLGLDLSAGDEVIITTQEHPAGRQPWLFRQERHGISIKEVFIPSPFMDEGQVIEAFRHAITPRTRAIAFCHVTRGGHLYPVKALAELAKSHGIACLVDGAQAVGMFPVDLHDLGCDAYSASLHKWLLGPLTGALHVTGFHTLTAYQQ